MWTLGLRDSRLFVWADGSDLTQRSTVCYSRPRTGGDVSVMPSSQTAPRLLGHLLLLSAGIKHSHTDRQNSNHEELLDLTPRT